MATKPAFDPSLPFESKAASKPAFDPSQPFTVKSPEAPQVVDEAADLEGRFAVKNFGGSTADSVAYLQQKNPDKEVTVIGDEIVARPKNSNEPYKKLDPSKLEWADITDVAYDIPAGVLSGAAATGAGLLGGAASGGIGAVPSAALAGGATSAGLETLRQLIGKGVGASKEMSGTDIALAGGMGALSPVLFGTGATTGQVAKTMAGENLAGKLLGGQAGRNIMQKEFGTFIPKGEALTEVQKAMATEALQSAQSGALAGVGKKALSIFSGIGEDTLKAANEIVDPKTVASLVENGVQIDPAKAYTNLELAQIIEKSGSIQDLPGAAIDQIYSALETRKAEIGDKLATGLAGVSEPIDLSGLKSGLEAYIEKLRTQNKNANLPVISDEITRTSDFITRYLGSGTAKKEGEQVVRIGRQAPLEVDAGTAMTIKQALADFIDYQKSPIALDKTDRASKALRNVVIQTERKLDDQIYSKIPAGSELKAAYRENRDLLRDLFPRFKNENTALATIKNLGGQRNAVLRRQLEAFDRENATNVTGLAKLANVWSVFGAPANEAVSSGGATSTGKILRGGTIGAGLGYGVGLLSGIPGSHIPLSLAGGALGSMATSPAAVAGMLKGQKVLGKAIPQVVQKGAENIPYPGQMAGQSVWNMMRNRQ